MRFPLLHLNRSGTAFLGVLLTATLLGTTLASPPVAQAATPNAACVAQPFKSDAAHATWYRIPALVKTNAGSLLAFAEQRDAAGPASDFTDTSIVVSRSTDRGCSWSAPRVIADNGTDIVGNPAPVVDQATGQILLLSTDRAQGGTSLHGLHVQRSDDDGLTFTPYDKSGNDLFGLPGWSGGLTGPGHALQLTHGVHAGRIIVPLGYQRDGQRGAYGIISDDHGASWRIGYNARGNDHRQEGTATQLADGRVWISYHEQDPATPIGEGRIAAVSNDGASLSTPFERLVLPTVSVQASALTLTGTHAGQVLLSSPATKDTSVRRVMTIFTAKGNVPGQGWYSYPVALEDTPASYSDMVQLDDATVGILYETGETHWQEGIGYRNVPIADLTRGQSVKASVQSRALKQVRASQPLNVTVQARVPGSKSPAGSVSVKLTRLDKTKHYKTIKTLRLRLIHNGKGARVAFFGTQPRGTYHVEASYGGTARVKGAKAKTITIRVK